MALCWIPRRSYCGWLQTPAVGFSNPLNPIKSSPCQAAGAGVGHGGSAGGRAGGAGGAALAAPPGFYTKPLFVTMDPQPKISWIPENRQCHPSINKAQFVCRGAQYTDDSNIISSWMIPRRFIKTRGLVSSWIPERFSNDSPAPIGIISYTSNTMIDAVTSRREVVEQWSQ